MDRRELLTKVINGELSVQDARGIDKKEEAIFFEDGHYHSTSDHDPKPCTMQEFGQLKQGYGVAIVIHN